MPLGAFRSIMKWAANSAQNHGYNFSDVKNVRGRDTIFKEEITERLRLQSLEETFQPHIVHWLPEDRPTAIFVRKAVDSIIKHTPFR